MSTAPSLSDSIAPLRLQGLRGRLLKVPAQNAAQPKQLLLIYGHHASLERIFGIAEDLSQYGTVSAPDLPGFGGMESFYKIGKEPTLENLADYLAEFIEWHYDTGQKITVLGMSFGFAVAVKMLQRHPALANRIELLVSLVGLVHHDDFKIKRRTQAFMRFTARAGSTRPLAWFTRHVLLHPVVIRAAYRLVADRHVKLRDANPNERERRINFEIGLWHSNDVRTYLRTGLCMLTLDLLDAPVPLPVHHVAVRSDRYFDNARVEAHLGQVFLEAHVIYAAMDEGHAPTVVADAAAAADLIPAELRRVLKESNR